MVYFIHKIKTPESVVTDFRNLYVSEAGVFVIFVFPFLIENDIIATYERERINTYPIGYHNNKTGDER